MNRHLAAGLADWAAEELRWAKLCVALLALDSERRRDQRAAGRAAVSQQPVALRAAGGDLRLALLEEAQCETAAEAEGDPVAKRLASLLLDPVALWFGHSHDCSGGTASCSGRLGTVQPTTPADHTRR